MAILIHKATADATFGDLFSDTRSADWYRLWTGDASGSMGNFVDTGAFNTMGDGWIIKKHLQVLKPDFAQADDTHLWVQAWTPAKGFGDWEKGAVDFTAVNQVRVKTQVTGDTPLDQMFSDANVGLGTWYRVWISDPDNPDSGRFLDTPEGKGWIKPIEQGGDLSSIIFPAADPGESRDIWIRTWTQTQQKANWESWTVTTEKQAEEPEPLIDIQSFTTTLDGLELGLEDGFTDDKVIENSEWLSADEENTAENSYCGQYADGGSEQHTDTSDAGEDAGQSDMILLTGVSDITGDAGNDIIG